MSSGREFKRKMKEVYGLNELPKLAGAKPQTLPPKKYLLFHSLFVSVLADAELSRAEVKRRVEQALVKAGLQAQASSVNTPLEGALKRVFERGKLKAKLSQ
jgi:hypothetical protein